MILSMPNIKSAKKALRSSARKQGFNLQRKKVLKETLKSVNKLLIEKKVAEAEKMLPEAYQAIDKAAKRGVIKSNTASRQKSRLTSRVRLAKTK